MTDTNAPTACAANGLYHVPLLDHKVYCLTRSKAHRATGHNLHRFTPDCPTCADQKEKEA